MMSAGPYAATVEDEGKEYRHRLGKHRTQNSNPGFAAHGTPDRGSELSNFGLMTTTMGGQSHSRGPSFDSINAQGSKQQFLRENPHYGFSSTT